MSVEIVKMINDPQLRLGVVEVAGGVVRDASAALREQCVELAAGCGAAGYEIPEDKRRAIRGLLKIGGFSPSGRNRPAHELLVRDLQERAEFNHINNVVDVNNVISLKSMLPISIFDVAKLGDRLTVRIGEPGEGYVFNQSGQYLDVKRCICCCRGAGAGEPVGTPVKDSMATKIFAGATSFLGVVYGSAAGWTSYEMIGLTLRFADLLAAETGGHIIQASVC